MGYYVRVLFTSDQPIPLARLQEAINRSKLEAKLECDPGEEMSWEQITLSHSDGTAIASIERNMVQSGSLGEAELLEFADDIENEHPQTAVVWLKDYFSRVRAIYAFQVLSGTEIKNGLEIFGCAKAAVWNFAPSIFQADFEGFSNEAGYHILWQFSDRVKNSWAMGVLKDGRWIHFQMDLGNKKHREAFCKGEVPAGCKVIP